MYAPLYSALLDLKNKNQLSFHMPGHLGQKGMEDFSFLTDVDTTELPESDNLFSASGPIAEAERAAAAFFGTKKTRFLVGGSSSGVVSMVGSAVEEGDKIVCDRFCHRSLVSALILSGASPVWIQPEILRGGALWGGVDPAQVEKALKENPGAKAVFLTSPNYFGFASDIRRIAEIAKQYGAALLVDGAHGAHFGLSPLLPPSSQTQGADICVAGAHKTLPALTQTAYLHINRYFPRLEAMLRLCQSSSPSYVLMASLDYARAKMQSDGEALWTRIAGAALRLFPDQRELCGKYVFSKDPTRLVLPVQGNPFEAARLLRERSGISVECCYGEGLVCIVNSAHTPADLERLLSAYIDVRRCGGEPLPPIAPGAHRSVMTPREAFFTDCEAIELDKAEGRVLAREVLLYPPGVPLALPGEVITEADISAAHGLSAAGGEVYGLENGRLRCVK